MPELNTVFRRMSNITFSHSKLMGGTIPAMHESAQRLYLAAKQLMAVEGQSAVAALIGLEWQQTLNNWETRGVSKDGALMAQQAIGCDALWILTGEGVMRPGWPFAVPLERVTALGEAGIAYVEGRLLSAIDEWEGRLLLAEQAKGIRLERRPGKPAVQRRKA